MARAERRARATPRVALTLQCAAAHATVPSRRFFARCTRAALVGLRARAAVTVRVVDGRESRALNRRWRGVDRATNVLSFPLAGPPGPADDALGDIVICAPLVAREAAAQGKSLAAHWAHLTVHAVLHMVGFDHDEDARAERMERRERAVLRALGFPDPYAPERAS